MFRYLCVALVEKGNHWLSDPNRPNTSVYLTNSEGQAMISSC